MISIQVPCEPLYTHLYLLNFIDRINTSRTCQRRGYLSSNTFSSCSLSKRGMLAFKHIDSLRQYILIAEGAGGSDSGTLLLIIPYSLDMTILWITDLSKWFQKPSMLAFSNFSSFSALHQGHYLGHDVYYSCSRIVLIYVHAYFKLLAWSIDSYILYSKDIEMLYSLIATLVRSI